MGIKGLQDFLVQASEVHPVKIIRLFAAFTAAILMKEDDKQEDARVRLTLSIQRDVPAAINFLSDCEVGLSGKEIQSRCSTVIKRLSELRLKQQMDAIVQFEAVINSL